MLAFQSQIIFYSNKQCYFSNLNKEKSDSILLYCVKNKYFINKKTRYFFY